MGCSSFLRSPKKEEQQVPDTLVNRFSDPINGHEDQEEVDIMNDLERILGIEEDDDEKPLRDNMYSSCGQLNWELMDWDEFGNGEEQEELDIQEEDEDQKLVFEKETSKCFFEEESYLMNKKVIVKRENGDGLWDMDIDHEDNKRVSLNLNLNYQEVLDAWSDRGSLWAHRDFSLPMPPNAYYMGEVPVMEEERSTRREASVLRYKEKRQSRLFSKKIRYQVRKLNADKRPRLKQPSKMEKSTSVCHVVALPYPGRGHVNPMMNICKQLASRKQQNILISFVVTEEWHGLIGSEPIPENLRFATLPNVIPSEHGRADDFAGFVEAVSTNLEAPFEQLLDRLEPPVTIIMADCFMVWAVGFGNRKNIQVALLSPGSASVFSMLYHFELLVAKGHFPVDLSENGHEVIDYVPGISRTRLADFPTGFRQQGPRGRQVLNIALEAVYGASKAQYLLFTSAYELESQTVDALKAIFTIPVYTVGPSIPYFQLENNSSSATKYFQWLDSQPKQSVLYISMGSFLSVSNAQLDEIIAGVQNSGVKYLWVARDDASRFKDGCGDIGFIVPWCDQLMVLCHPSIGGFLTHCGWNSTMEAAFAGIPVLAAPIFADQLPNKKKIVEDWKIGYSVKNELEPEKLVTRDEIAELVKRFMDLESNEGKEMRKRAKKLQEACRSAIAKGGSSDKNLDAFIENISQGHGFFS